MGIQLNIGNIDIRNVDAFSWAAFWAGQGEPIFFGEVSRITDGKLYNQKNGSSDYLTVAGAAGSYTFQCPNTAAYIAADTDYIWFKKDTTQRTTTEAELVGYDLQHTPVKYDDNSPNSIRWICILSSTISAGNRNKLFRSFYLPIMWDDSWNDYGHSKDNRSPVEQQLWTPDPFDADLNEYTPRVIGTQTWLLENLQTTKYNDGSTIKYEGLTYDTRNADTEGTYQYPNSYAADAPDAGLKAAYGLIYSGFVVRNVKGVAPSGYHIPTNADLGELVEFLGGNTVAGGHLKETGTTHWTVESAGCDNSSGFTGVGAGHQDKNEFKARLSLWASDESLGALYYIKMPGATDITENYTAVNANWKSIRCIKD